MVCGSVFFTEIPGWKYQRRTLKTGWGTEKHNAAFPVYSQVGLPLRTTVYVESSQLIRSPLAGVLRWQVQLDPL